MAGGLQSAPIGFAAPATALARTAARECWTHTAADVDAWFDIAKAGESFVYAHGPQLVQGAAATRVAALTKAGDVTPHQRRADDGGFDYIVRRTSRPRLPINRDPVCTSAMITVLIAIQEDALAQRRCRSDADIAAAVGMTVGQVKWHMVKLEEAKFIARNVVATKIDPKFRIITVTATGQSTAGPEA